MKIQEGVVSQIKDAPQISQEAQIKQNILGMDEQRIHRNTRFFKDYLKDQLKHEMKKGTSFSKILTTDRKSRRGSDDPSQSNKDKDSVLENNDLSETPRNTRLNEDRKHRKQKLLQTMMKKAQSMAISQKLKPFKDKSVSTSEKNPQSVPHTDD